MRFVAIDIEIANPQYSSICSLGLVVFQDGVIVEEKHYLVNPKTHFGDMQMRIHGIRPDDVVGSPDFTEIYPELLAALEGQVVVSHTAFDVQSIGKTLAHHSLPSINFHHANSCDVSRIAWPGLRDYKLNTVAKHLGVGIDHHNALADARTSGEIFVKAIQAANIPFESFIPVPKAKARARKAIQPKETVQQAPPTQAPTLGVKDRLVGLESSYIEPYPVQVEGESSYRANLEKIVGYYDEDEGYNNDAHIAALYLDEPDAVRVEIDDLKVGYLPESAARRLRKKMIELGGPDNPIMICGARIKGGQRISGGFVTQFGVRLDFSLKSLKLTRVRYENQWLYPKGVEPPGNAPEAGHASDSTLVTPPVNQPTTGQGADPTSVSTRPSSDISPQPLPVTPRQTIAPSQPPTPEQRRRSNLIIIVILLLVVLCCILVGSKALADVQTLRAQTPTLSLDESLMTEFPVTDTPTGPTQIPQIQAWNQCVQLIEQQETLPAADAQEYDAKNVGVLVNNKYQIKIYYPSENSLYRCNIQQLSTGKWDLLSLDLIPSTPKP